jgi:hypothetical protein
LVALIATVAGSATDAGMPDVAATIIATRNGVITINAVMPIPASATATREEETEFRMGTSHATP